MSETLHRHRERERERERGMGLKKRFLKRDVFTEDLKDLTEVE